MIVTFGGKVITNSQGQWVVHDSSSPVPGPSFDEVTIGTQTWTAKNIVYDDDGGGISTKNVSANGVNWGKQTFYTWDAAMRVADAIPGWHLPSEEEYLTLINYAGGEYTAGKKLKSSSGWYMGSLGGNGTDDYGFTGTPSGYVDNSGSPWYDLGELGWMWTSTRVSSASGGNPNNRKAFRLYWNSSGAIIDGTKHNGCQMPIRLIKDA